MKRLLPIVILFAIALPVAAQQPAGDARGYTAAYVVEPTTGQVLFAYNHQKPLPTASMAKMMTLLIAMERIKEGEITLDTPVTISARASKMGGSQVYLRQGDQWPMRNLIIATMVHSANDAAQAIAEKIGGSSELFVDTMNQRAQQLGLRNSRFFDPHGLPPNPGSENNVMSAEDLAKLGVELMKYPMMQQLAKISEMDFKNGTLEKIYNPNRLLKFYEGTTGIKTGYSGPAGFCVTASARRNGMDLVAVVMGAKTSRGPESSFELAAKLMNEAFANYRMVKVVSKGAVVGQAPVADGKVKSVPVIASRDVTALVKRGENAAAQPKFAATALTAPVRPGQPAGTLVVQQNGRVIAKVPAVAQTAVEKQAWWRAFLPW